MRKTSILGMILISLTLFAIGSANCSDLLHIYGNANLDNTIDQKDIDYSKGVIDGTNKATNLTDANNDGKIDEKDISLIESIIKGEDTNITIVDMANRTVKVPRPAKRIVLSDMLDGINILVQLGAQDRIVGISDGGRTNGYGQLVDGKANSWWTPLILAAPKLKDLPVAGTWQDPNVEKIVSLKPDLVVVYNGRNAELPDIIQSKTGVPTISVTNFGASSYANFADAFRLYSLFGWIVGKERRTEELISYTNEKIKSISDITSKIPNDDRPKVYMAGWSTYLTQTPLRYEPIDLAGGYNVAKNNGSNFFMVDVSKEKIIQWNPDVILIHRVPTTRNNVLWKNNRTSILSDPDLRTINAIKNQKVYYTKGFCAGWDPSTGLAEVCYMAKLFYPDKFKDLDDRKECNEILKEFWGVDGIWTEIANRDQFYSYD
jgi:iron complex transport system substrate-binding protein